MPYREIPYRGEVRSKLHGHPSPSNPNEKVYTFFFWFILISIGLVIFYFAARMAAVTGNTVGFLFFIIYLIFLVVIIFAIQDLKKVKMITSDIDDEDKEYDDEGNSLADDYFSQIEWVHIHHRGRHSSRWSRPEPKWRYQRVQGANGQQGCLFILGMYLSLFTLFFVFVIIASIFKVNSPITIFIVIVAGVVGVVAYLIRQS
jgi:hypothetical protein